MKKPRTPTRWAVVVTLTSTVASKGATSEIGSACLAESLGLAECNPAEAPCAGYGADIAMTDEWAAVASYYWGDGAVFVFRREGGMWTHETVLTRPPATEGAFGTSVALSGDTLVAGGYNFGDVPGTDSSGAWVFRHDGSEWDFETQLLPDDNPDPGQALFGFALAIEDDTILVGAPWDDEMGQNVGATYVFRSEGDAVWTQIAKLTLSAPAGVYGFGLSVDLSGEHAAVGASDTVYLFAADAGVWVEEAVIIPPAGGPISTALFKDTVLVGVPHDGTVGPDAGAVYVYRFSEGDWLLSQVLMAMGGQSGDQLGHSVALEGKTALVSAPFDDDHGGPAPGSIRVFRCEDDSFIERGRLIASDQSEPRTFGEKLAIAGHRVLASTSFGLFPSGEGFVHEFSGISDCNGNGTLDLCDIQGGGSRDADGDGMPDECQCPSDTDGDGVVDVLDLLAVLMDWGTDGSGRASDVNGDGIVNVMDLIAVVVAWGPCA